MESQFQILRLFIRLFLSSQFDPFLFGEAMQMFCTQLLEGKWQAAEACMLCKKTHFFVNLWALKEHVHNVHLVFKMNTIYRPISTNCISEGKTTWRGEHKQHQHSQRSLFFISVFHLKSHTRLILIFCSCLSQNFFFLYMHYIALYFWLFVKVD